MDRSGLDLGRLTVREQLLQCRRGFVKGLVGQQIKCGYARGDRQLWIAGNLLALTKHVSQDFNGLSQSVRRFGLKRGKCHASKCAAVPRQATADTGDGRRFPPTYRGFIFLCPACGK